MILKFEATCSKCDYVTIKRLLLKGVSFDIISDNHRLC